MRYLVVFFLAFLGTFIIDQAIKDLFVNGYFWDSKCISLELHYNKGVAFSMLASLGPYVKWLQITLITVVIIFTFYEGYIKKFPFALGLLVGGAVGNIYDRFHHEGVVDYVAWHCGFDFAIFNYADVMIDIAIVWILIVSFIEERRNKKLEENKKLK
jgi:signal peptidase II